jgi:DNA polymerase zeta
MAHSRKRDTTVTCDDSEIENTSAIQNDNEHPENHETGAVDIRSINQSSPYKSSSDPSSIITPKSTSSAFRFPSLLSISLTPNSNGYVYAVPPPSTSELVGTVDDYAIPSKIYRNAYFSKESDAPGNPREYAGLLYHLKGGEGLNTLDEWDGKTTKSKAKTDEKRKSTAQRYWPVAGGYEYASCPPSPREVRKWLATDAGRRPFKQKTLNTQSQVRYSSLHLVKNPHLPSGRRSHAD